MTQTLVLDASAMVAMLIGGAHAEVVSSRLRGCVVHVPAHFDAEVMSALGRLHRAGELESQQVADSLEVIAEAPFERHQLAPLLAAAWSRRANVRLVGALYVALAEALSAPLITLDRGLASASRRAELLVV